LLAAGLLTEELEKWAANMLLLNWSTLHLVGGAGERPESEVVFGVVPVAKTDLDAKQPIA